MAEFDLGWLNNLLKTREQGPHLSELAHRLWVYWSQHIAKEEHISNSRLERWEDLWVPFDELSEEQKDEDRRMVQRFMTEDPF